MESLKKPEEIKADKDGRLLIENKGNGQKIYLDEADVNVEAGETIYFMGAITQLVGSKRGVILDVTQDSATVAIKAKIPVNEMIGWSNDLRSATEGRGVSSLADQQFQKLPAELQHEVIRQIRDRKGLAENQ